jgi:hypothetical protein
VSKNLSLFQTLKTIYSTLTKTFICSISVKNKLCFRTKGPVFLSKSSS